MSYPNPRRRRYFRRADIAGYDICFGSPSEVVEAVSAMLEKGWEPKGDTFFFTLGEGVYAAQTMIKYKPEPKDDDDEDKPLGISARGIQ